MLVKQFKLLTVVRVIEISGVANYSHTSKGMLHGYLPMPHRLNGRDSSVGIATRYGLDGPGIESRCGVQFFPPVQTGPGAHPASCTMGTGSFPGVKRPGRGADHPPPSSAEVMKG